MTKRVPNRRELLSLFPVGGVYAELGVFRGQFSERILETCRPSRLYLVDLWQDGGDRLIDGAVKTFTGNEAMRETLRLEPRPAVRIRRQRTVEFLESLPNESLDVVYLDSGHQYELVRDELVMAFPRVKCGGWISGHDYCDVFPGVIRAVDEFVARYGLQIDYLTDEPTTVSSKSNKDEKTVAYNSYAIQVTK